MSSNTEKPSATCRHCGVTCVIHGGEDLFAQHPKNHCHYSEWEFSERRLWEDAAANTEKREGLDLRAEADGILAKYNSDEIEADEAITSLRSLLDCPPASTNPDFDYPAAARSIALNLSRWFDPAKPYPMAIADAARDARDHIESLEAAHKTSDQSQQWEDFRRMTLFGLRHGPSCAEYCQPVGFCSCGVSEAFARLQAALSQPSAGPTNGNKEK